MNFEKKWIWRSEFWKSEFWEVIFKKSENRRNCEFWKKWILEKVNFFKYLRYFLIIVFQQILQLILLQIPFQQIPIIINLFHLFLDHFSFLGIIFSFDLFGIRFIRTFFQLTFHGLKCELWKNCEFVGKMWNCGENVNSWGKCEFEGKVWIWAKNVNLGGKMWISEKCEFEIKCEYGKKCDFFFWENVNLGGKCEFG